MKHEPGTRLDLIGAPGGLNTSFKPIGKTIVTTPANPSTTFSKSGLDDLVHETLLVEKPLR